MSRHRPSNPSPGNPGKGAHRPVDAKADSGPGETAAKPGDQAPAASAGESRPGQQPSGAPGSSGAGSGESGSREPGKAAPGDPTKPGGDATKPEAGATGSAKPPASVAASAGSAKQTTPSSTASAASSSTTKSAGGTPPGGSGGGPGGSGSSGKSPPPSSPRQAPPLPPAPPPQQQPSRGGGWVAGIVGGVIGAVLAIFGAPYVQGPPPLAPEPAARLQSVEGETAAVGERLGAVEGELGTTVETVAGLQSLQESLEPTVRQAVADAVAEIPSQDAAAIDAMQQEIDGLAGEVEALRQVAETAAALAPQLEAQAQRLEALQATLSGLDNRLTVETQRQDSARAEAVSGLEQQLAEARSGLEQQLAETASGLESRLEEAAADRTAMQEAAGDQLAQARTALSGDIEAVGTSLAGTAEELADVRAIVEELRQTRARAAAAALLVRDIDQSIDKGTAFAEPLDRLAAMGAGDAALEETVASLEPYAEAGVPTIAELREGLVSLEATEPTPPVAGSEWLGRTVGNITDLVQVRERGSERDVASGRLAEADAALREGDVDRAIGIVEDLAATPDAVDPTAAEDWLADTRARATAITAQAALDAHIRELLTATVN